MTGIDDVARDVGMSTATVSRALRGLPRVSESTRLKVSEAALRLGYVPSPHAARLASGRTGSVAIVVPFVTRWFFATIYDGVEQTLRRADYDVLVYNLAGDAATRKRVLGTHELSKRVDAILLLGIEPTPDEVAWLGERGAPVSTLGTEVAHWPSVRIDDGQVARTAVEHLIDLGHRRIGTIGGHIDEGLDVVTPSDRRAAYRRTLVEHGMELLPELETEGGFTLEGGYRSGLQLLDVSPRPTAVFCASDEMAVGLLRACRERGVRVPEELSIVGVDDHEMSPYLDLTTVRQPVFEQGVAAAQQIVDRLSRPATTDDEPVAALEAEHLVLPTELVVRGSTASPPARSSG